MGQSNKKTVTIVVILIIVVLFAGYIYYQSRNFFLGPRLSITQPSESSSTVVEERLTISGTATNISALTLNGGAIPINQHNIFEESLLLAEGFNIIEVTATDRFDHVRTETRVVVYTPEEKPQPVATTTVATSSDLITQ